MEEMVEAGIILSFDEFRILLYSMGIQTVEGIYMPEKKFSVQDIIQALHHMSVRGIIVAEQDAFTIRKDLLKILEIVGNPGQTIIWRPDITDEVVVASKQQYFCYIAQEQVVVSERYWKKKDTLKLRRFTKKEFEQWRKQVAYDNS